MRKALCGIGILLMLAGCMLAGCSGGGEKPEVPTSIMDVLGDDMRAIYDNRDTSLPAAVLYIFQGNGVRVESPLYGDADVNAALDAIAAIAIVAETDLAVTDSDSRYVFINADGSEAGSIAFNGKFLDCGDKKYEVENKKALTAMDFPAESEADTLSIEGPDPIMHAFLDRCRTEDPVSIKVVRDASEYEITQSDVIREAVDALYAIGLPMYALQGTEPPTTTLTATFVMQDGWEYSLTLYDESIYVYEYPAPLGAWSFYTNGAEYLIDALQGAA